MESIWSQTCRLRQREALPGDMKTDIAVIGAGMAGILIASAQLRKEAEAAPIWAASWSGTRMSAAGTAHAMAPALTAGAS